MLHPAFCLLATAFFELAATTARTWVVPPHPSFQSDSGMEPTVFRFPVMFGHQPFEFGICISKEPEIGLTEVTLSGLSWGVQAVLDATAAAQSQPLA